MTPANVCAVVVTRGDVAVGQIRETLSGFGQFLLADNGAAVAKGGRDEGPFAQFLFALLYSKPWLHWLYFQDDDVLTDPVKIVEAASHGRVVCNMSAEYRREYEGKPDRLMGFGSVFERALIPQTFARYRAAGFELDALTRREPGRLFTGLHRCALVDVPIEHLPWATGPDRLYRQPDHGSAREEMRARIAKVREWESQK